MAKNGKRLGFLPGWRIGTYVVLIFNALMLIWVISAVASASGDATDCGTLSQETCNAARNTGTGIGVFLLIVLWAIVDIILGVIWMVTNNRNPAQSSSVAPTAGSTRACPFCAEPIQRAAVVCRHCGRDVLPMAAEPVPEIWPPVVPRTP